MLDTDTKRRITAHYQDLGRGHDDKGRRRMEGGEGEMVHRLEAEETAIATEFSWVEAE